MHLQPAGDVVAGGPADVVASVLGSKCNTYVVRVRPSMSARSGVSESGKLDLHLTAGAITALIAQTEGGPS
jgi:hypothetical protein